MPVNMSGAEYRRFLNADWGADAYWEDYILTVDGVTPEDSDEADGLIKDGSLVTITGGFIVPDANNYAVEKNIDGRSRRQCAMPLQGVADGRSLCLGDFLRDRPIRD